MMPGRRAPRDPRQDLVRVVDRLSDRRQFVTYADIEHVATRATSRLSADGLPTLIEEAVAESLLLKDWRTFYDRKTGQYADAWVYRVNPRHPLVAELIADE